MVKPLNPPYHHFCVCIPHYKSCPLHSLTTSPLTTTWNPKWLTIWKIKIKDPEHHPVLVETNLPTPMTARVFVNGSQVRVTGVSGPVVTGIGGRSWMQRVSGLEATIVSNALLDPKDVSYTSCFLYGFGFVWLYTKTYLYIYTTCYYLLLPTTSY